MRGPVALNLFVSAAKRPLRRPSCRDNSYETLPHPYSTATLIARTGNRVDPRGAIGGTFSSGVTMDSQQSLSNAAFSFRFAHKVSGSRTRGSRCLSAIVRTTARMSTDKPSNFPTRSYDCAQSLASSRGFHAYGYNQAERSVGHGHAPGSAFRRRYEYGVSYPCVRECGRNSVDLRLQEGDKRVRYWARLIVSFPQSLTSRYDNSQTDPPRSRQPRLLVYLILNSLHSASSEFTLAGCGQHFVPQLSRFILILTLFFCDRMLERRFRRRVIRHFTYHPADESVLRICPI